MALAATATTRQIVARVVKTAVQSFAGAWLGLNISLDQSTWAQVKTGLLIAASAGVLSLMTNLAVVDPPKAVVVPNPPIARP